MTEKEFRSFIIRILRRGSYKWPARNAVLKRARVDRGQYQCAICGPGKTYDRHSIALDHIHPMIDPAIGFIDWNTLIPRLFCDESNFQVLCDEHHKLKSKDENAIRKQTRQEANAQKRAKRKLDKKKNPTKNKHTSSSMEEFLKECGIDIDKSQKD